MSPRWMPGARALQRLRRLPWGPVCLCMLLLFGGLTAPLRKRNQAPSQVDTSIALDHNCGCASALSCAGGCCCDPDWRPPTQPEDSEPMFTASCGRPLPATVGGSRILLCPSDEGTTLAFHRPELRCLDWPSLWPSEHRPAPPTPPPRS